MPNDDLITEMNDASIVECAQENINFQMTLITNVTHIVWN